jgi:hypothetical protein
MFDRVAVSQAARVLGISQKTIERAIDAGAVKDYQTRPNDDEAPAERAAGAKKKTGPKYYLIDLAETRAYFEARGTLVRAKPPEGDKAIIHQLLDEIARLKDELDKLNRVNAIIRRDHIGPLTAHPQLAAPVAPPVPPVSRPVVPRPVVLTRQQQNKLILTFDNGIMSGHSIRKLCNVHGIRGETARHSWAEKMGEARRSRAEVLRWVQERLIEVGLPPMLRCIEPSCDCQAMEGAWRERTDEEAALAMKIGIWSEPERVKYLKEHGVQHTKPSYEEDLQVALES